MYVFCILFIFIIVYMIYIEFVYLHFNVKYNKFINERFKIVFYYKNLKKNKNI